MEYLLSGSIHICLSFQFYKDTLESSMDEGNNESMTESRECKRLKRFSIDRPMKSQHVSKWKFGCIIAPEDSRSPTNEKDTSADEEPKQTVIKSAEGLKSALALYRAKKAPKKSVKWKIEEELEAVQYFEVDVSERGKLTCEIDLFHSIVDLMNLCFI